MIVEAVGKRPSAALPSSLVTAAYFYIRLTPRDFVPQWTAGWTFSINLSETGFSIVSFAIQKA
jgi:hypothetical protein